MPDTKYMASKIMKNNGLWRMSGRRARGKNDKSHGSGLPEEVIRLQGWPNAIIVALRGLFDVVSAHPKY